MINILLIFPIIACVLVLLVKNKAFDTWIVNLYAVMHLVISSMLALGYGKNNFTPYFEIDGTNALFLLVLSVVFLMVTIYNNGYIKTFDFSPNKISRYSFMILIFVLSMTGTLLSTDLGLAWILIEATTLSSAYLIYFNKTKHSIEAAWKYVFICSIGIALAFVGIILLTFATGNLNSLYFGDLITNASTFNPFWLKLSFVFILFGIGTKMGLAPVHFWLPDAHAEAPSPISALLSATLLNSAFLMIFNVFGIMIAANCDFYARIMMLAMGFLSLFITAVFVYHIKNYKRMLAYSSIENMGILIIGLALGGVAVTASIMHLIGHSLIKASFFLTSGNILKIYSTKKIKSVAGLLNVDGLTGWLWILSFVGIAAFPPSILFVSEFMIIKSMFAQNKLILCIIFLLLLTIVLYGLAKAVISMSFLPISEEKEQDLIKEVKKINWTMYLPQILMLVLAFVLGVNMPDKLVDLINKTVMGY